MNEIKVPLYFGDCSRPWLYLAGSIEMGADWQENTVAALRDYQGTILNPRRDHWDRWDRSWAQSIHNEQFREQFEWELSAQEQANLIALYLSPGTRSPISLLELGLFKRQSMIVCCPEGFWRKRNVDIVCSRYGIKNVDSIEDFEQGIVSRLRRVWKQQRCGREQKILEEFEEVEKNLQPGG